MKSAAIRADGNDNSNSKMDNEVNNDNQMNNNKNNANNDNSNNKKDTDAYDYTFVDSVARIACYDDMKAAPRVTMIKPASTDQFIMDMATTTYEQAKLLGGKIPFTIIKEVSENFIHARFKEITISIFDNGNTIRFADQGPGIEDKEKVKLPGYSSAIEPMKQYIRGVGSGLPIVKDYFEEKHGSVTIDDNVLSGAVVTISLKEDEEIENQNIPLQTGYYDNTVKQPINNQFNSQPIGIENPQIYGYKNQQPMMIGNNGRVPMYMPQLPLISERGKECLKVLKTNGVLGVTKISELTGIPNSSTFNELKKLEEAGLIETVAGKKKVLSQAAWNLLDYI